MPKLWTETIEAHRRAVHAAILETTVGLVIRHGLASVSMSRIAEETGIGRATLYKYFPDVEAILLAWHERHVGHHLEHLERLRDRHGTPAERLRAVLEAYATIQRDRRDSEVAALVHRHQQHMAPAQRRLGDLVRDLLIEGVRTREVRSDVPPEELTSYCLHALGAASGLPSAADAERLVNVVLAGLRPPG
ncbi:MAG TPA: TetR/AcrR family transcriptional regulator [Chloroflexota bacterium]